MFIPAVVEFFKHKVVGSVIVLVCLTSHDAVKYAKEFSQNGMKVTISSDPAILDHVLNDNFQGVLYIKQEQCNVLERVSRIHFDHRYKWLVVNDSTLHAFRQVRYDCDITMLRDEIDLVYTHKTTSFINASSTDDYEESILFFDDVYVHPRDGVSVHEWGLWSRSSGFRVTRDLERIHRRLDLKKYPLRIAAPVAHYSEEAYKQSFGEYLVNLTVPDAGLRCGYGASALLIEAVNATEVLLTIQYWASEKEQNSTLLTLSTGSADLGAGVLRIMEERRMHLDYVMPIWLFSVGFTYLAERESSSNMYVEPFTASVWLCCLIVGLILAVAQRVTSRSQHEKDGAFIAVLATWLQQDASAVPEGISGRWTFTVLSVSSMLVHAYYTSAIVSALMSTGRGGPKTLRALGDSKYAIASEDHDFIKEILFNIKTDWADLEYLKKKKLTSKFYKDIETGVKLVEQGSTAYHAEYHQIYHYLGSFSDDDVCKLQYIDTIPETMTWVSATSRGQWTNVLRSAGSWLYETGLAKRLVSRIQIHPPPCRVALIAERVTFGDVAPLLALTTLGAVTSLSLLGLEILVAKYVPRKKLAKKASASSQVDLISIE